MAHHRCRISPLRDQALQSGTVLPFGQFLSAPIGDQRDVMEAGRWLADGRKDTALGCLRIPQVLSPHQTAASGRRRFAAPARTTGGTLRGQSSVGLLEPERIELSTTRAKVSEG